MSFDAFWLPHLPPDVRILTRTLFDGSTIRFPELTHQHVLGLCQSLLEAADRARAITVRERIAALDRAVALLGDPAGELFGLATRLIPVTTGYSAEMTRYVLERMSQDWTGPALETLVAAELGDPAPLEGPVRDPQTGRRVAAYGPGLTAHIFSGNVPGVAVTSLIRALLVKAASFGKTASDEPVLPVLFARALNQAHPVLAETLALTYWPGGTDQPEAALFRAAETVIVYGGVDTAAAARQRIGPGARLIVHGPRLSFGLVNAAALDPEQMITTADDVALACSIFDQQGCVSPHLIYLLGSEPLAADFARRLADALARVETQLPRGRLSAAEAAAVQEARARAEFRAIAGQKVILYAGPRASFTVVFDPDDAFEVSCLNRLVYVKYLPQLDRLPGLLEAVRPFLQSIGMAGFTESQQAELATLLGPLGVSRMTSFVALPWPPPAWHHDGSEPLRELIRWIDLET